MIRTLCILWRWGCIFPQVHVSLQYQNIFSFSNRLLFNYKKIVDLIVVLHQLDDHPDVVAVVLDRDDPHDIGRVLRKR